MYSIKKGIHMTFGKTWKKSRFIETHSMSSTPSPLKKGNIMEYVMEKPYFFCNWMKTTSNAHSHVHTRPNFLWFGRFWLRILFIRTHFLNGTSHCSTFPLLDKSFRSFNPLLSLAFNSSFDKSVSICYSLLFRYLDKKHTIKFKPNKLVKCT